MIDRMALQGFDLSDRRAAVIGCGGLGCSAATHLSCAGIGELVICDRDTVSESNLNRQFLYGYEDVGKKKVFLAKNRLSETAPYIKITAVEADIASPEDLTFAKEADIIVLAADNNDCRRAVSQFCKENNIPLVNGGVNGFFGTAYLYIPGMSPDLESAGLLGTENRKTLSVSSTVGVIGSLEAHLAIKYLIGDASCAGRLHIFDDGEISVLNIKNTR